MSDFPLVTIYITTFNRLALLKRAVESVRNQDYWNIEVIVVDDCSTDDTVGYLTCISKADRRIRFFVNEKNSGACKSRNVALGKAEGEFITGLDDDDYFLPARISTFLKAWVSATKETVALTSSVSFQMAGRTKTLRRPQLIKKKDLIDGNLVGSQVFTRTEYLRKIGGFDEQMPIWQDYECWLRLFGVSSGATIEAVREVTYVVDVSHQFERISHGRLVKLKKAVDIMSSKHSLTSLEIEILSAEILIESNKRLTASFLARKIIRNPRLRNVKATLGLFFRSYLHR